MREIVLIVMNIYTILKNIKKNNNKFPNLINHLIKLICLHLYVNFANKRIIL
jgi:hypothetical protein